MNSTSKHIQKQFSKVGRIFSRPILRTANQLNLNITKDENESQVM